MQAYACLIYKDASDPGEQLIRGISAVRRDNPAFTELAQREALGIILDLSRGSKADIRAATEASARAWHRHTSVRPNPRAG